MLKQVNKLICTGVILSSLSMIAQADVVDNISQSFDVSNSPRLHLQNINGDVSITAWDKSVIQVNATITADSQKDRDLVSVVIEQTGRGIEVESKYKKNTHNKGSSAEVVYKVMVPSATDLSTISLVNGSLVIGAVKGGIEAELVNGTFKAKDIAGNANISSVNGSVKLHYSDDIEQLEEIKLEAVNGSIKLYLPEGIGADVSVDTMHGSIKNDFLYSTWIISNNLIRERFVFSSMPCVFITVP